jgi:hypothetical protein
VQPSCVSWYVDIVERVHALSKAWTVELRRSSRKQFKTRLLPSSVAFLPSAHVFGFAASVSTCPKVFVPDKYPMTSRDYASKPAGRSALAMAAPTESQAGTRLRLVCSRLSNLFAKISTSSETQRLRGLFASSSCMPVASGVPAQACGGRAYLRSPSDQCRPSRCGTASFERRAVQLCRLSASRVPAYCMLVDGIKARAAIQVASSIHIPSHFSAAGQHLASETPCASAFSSLPSSCCSPALPRRRCPAHLLSTRPRKQSSQHNRVQRHVLMLAR